MCCYKKHANTPLGNVGDSKGGPLGGTSYFIICSILVHYSIMLKGIIVLMTSIPKANVVLIT